MTVAAPFLNLQSFTVDEVEAPPPTRGALSMRSPFVSVYEIDGVQAEAAYDDPVREAYARLVDDLHDEEFDEALHELRSHARALHDEQLAMGTPRAEADRVLTQHFSQLVRESETMVDALAHEFGTRDETGIVEQEIDSFVDAYSPSANFDPEFEDFFKKLGGKLGRFAKAAVGGALRGLKKLALGPVFMAIKAVLKPVLNGVLQQAIGRLPAPIQPAARQLAHKLGLGPAPDAAAADAAAATTAAAPGTGAAAVQDAAGADAAGTQQELDEQFAATLLAQDEVELNLETAQLRTSHGAAASPVFADLDDARQRFIQRLQSLQQDESAAPHIQEFLPAVLPALRLGLRVVGKPRVIGFLSQLLAKLVAKLIGPEQAPALSRAIVEAGFKLLQLEAQSADGAPAQSNQLAASAVAATVEETLARVAALPEHVLDNEELLEGFALEAFESAAAANLPALFSRVTYQQRPALLEGGLDAGWVMLPLQGPKRYKRCTRSFKLMLSPYIAGEVESFEGAPLADYLQDQLGLAEGDEVQAELNLYESLPGTSLADIAHGERQTLGAGMSDEANAAQLHPLTPQAASALLGKPSLGRNLPAVMNPHRLAAGQRLFHIGVAGQRPLTVQGPGRRPHLRRRFRINITLDRPADQARLCVFISEVKAQKLAQRLREPANLGVMTIAFQRWIARRLDAIFLGQARGRLRTVHAGLRPGPVDGKALADLPQSVRQAFKSKLHEALVRGFATFAKTQAARFLTATEDAADGVTLRFTVEHPQGMKEFLQALAAPGQAAAAASAMAGAAGNAGAPNVRVDVFPGRRCG